ncbi:MAG TPA: hypothetical protein ENL19_02275 [candidate division WOR-3 bacterium]|uniref:PSP1 C-terminal domain-containing protein n=1 Tax=candidate division WOR-3 bacterium TaxID=2052148 RepID=A0A7C5HFW8_UNCW3|nr:hypothetical protein [candidate division WOR-3 bacterium]
MKNREANRTDRKMDEKLNDHISKVIEGTKDIEGPIEDSNREEINGLGTTEKVEEVKEKKLYALKLLYNHEICFTEVDNIRLLRYQSVVIETDNGPEIAAVLGEVKSEHNGVQIRKFLRICTDEDFKKKKKNEERAKEAFNIALEKIKKHKLDMKLVSVHYFLDDNKVLFNFTADERVDFRELVKDLASVFKKRIELRQIGARDEAKIVQGIGVCGRPFCCNSVKYELQPVTIKMAKDQNLTLNSSKISGACGRLLCCLAYEHELYAEIKDQYPEEGSKVVVNGEEYTLSEINVVKRKAQLKTSDGITMYIPLEELPKREKPNTVEEEQEVIIEDI